MLGEFLHLCIVLVLPESVPGTGVIGRVPDYDPTSGLPLSLSPCPDGFSEFEGRCFALSREKATFTRCQAEFCAPAGGTLVTVDNGAVNNFLWNYLIADRAHFAFIGLYQPGRSEKSNWTWVDGEETTFSGWRPGEPDNWCVEEDCGIMIPRRETLAGWDDVSCNVPAHCLCELGGNSSLRFQFAQNNLIGTGRPQYGRCGKGRQCFWSGSTEDHTIFQYVFVLTAIPALLILIFSLRGRCVKLNEVERNALDEEDEMVIRSLHYGMIIGKDGQDDIDHVINDWIWWGVFWSLSYAVALLALAATNGLRYAGFEVNVGFDACEAFVMFCSQLGVGFCVRTVNTHLSPLAKSVAGPWVTALATTKFLMSVGALALASIYLTMADGIRSAEAFCELGYIFCWSMLLSMVCQSSSGVAMTRISERSLGYIGDRSAISKIVGCWWAALIISTYAVGASLWSCGAMLVFDSDRNRVNPLKLVPMFFFLAAVSQCISSLALYQVNIKVRGYFGSPEGQMVAAEMNAALSESE
mmetsp:Transcript_110709/g.191888  ORF Transcript_110709/g.191888 Transcript_110709/m.191888 type:complete len:526 (+) Transcript_110709:58-1635(+)